VHRATDLPSLRETLEASLGDGIQVIVVPTSDRASEARVLGEIRDAVRQAVGSA